MGRFAFSKKNGNNGIISFSRNKKKNENRNNQIKEVFAKNERGYRLTAKNNRFRSLLILLLSVASIRRKLLKTSHTE